MKVNFKQILVFIGVVLITILMLFAVLSISSCSNSRMIEYHLKKAEKRGGKIVCDTTFIEVPKLVKGKDGKDSLIFVKVPIECQPCQPCETKREIKWRYKYDLKKQKARDAFIIDSMSKVFNKDVKVSKIEGKQAKIETKAKAKTDTANNKSWNITMIAFSIFGVLAVLIFLYKRFIPK